jgi:hypothetical protein
MKKSLFVILGWPFAAACTLGIDNGPGGFSTTAGSGGSAGGAGSSAAGSGGFDPRGAGGAGAGGIGGNGGSGNGNSDAGAVTGGGGGAAGSAGGNAAASGLPCDLANFLMARCQTCHSNPPIAGAPMPLVTYGDLVAPAKSDPAKSAAAMALTRMQDTTRPMPPPPATRASASEIAQVSTWISSGQPRGTCATVPAADGGTGGVTGADAGNPFNTPPVCTSGRTSTVAEGANMAPGQACIACHATNEAPDFTIAGTVYPSAHEPNNCVDAVASAAGATVVIVDAANRTLTLAVNAVGSFYSTTPITTPFRAKVVVGTSERVMGTPQTTGDCNGCHTQNGANSAPGRILLP